MNRLLGLLVFATMAGCYSPNVPNGQLKCSTGGKCPDGFHCATDGTCWKNGADPVVMMMPDMTHPPVIDMSQPVVPDMGPMPVVPHSATSVMSGGVTATS